MNNQLTLQQRDVRGKAVKRLLTGGLLPCVAYGKGIASATAQVPYREFENVYRKAGSSALVDLVLPGGNAKKALITEVARNPMSGTLVHADFYIVDMSEKMKAKIPLNFIGESRAVKELAANLTKTLQELEIECLPNDLPRHIDVDLGVLVAIGDMIRVSEIKLPDGVLCLDQLDVVVATVELVKEETEEKVPATAEQEKEAIEQLKTEQQEKKATKEEESTVAEPKK